MIYCAILPDVTLLPYTTLFRSNPDYIASAVAMKDGRRFHGIVRSVGEGKFIVRGDAEAEKSPQASADVKKTTPRSEEHTSELQSPCNLVCRLLREKKKNTVLAI